MLIFCVWVLSFIVCFPPLIGWNERGGLDFSDDVAHHNWTRPPTDDVMPPEVQVTEIMYYYQNVPVTRLVNQTHREGVVTDLVQKCTPPDGET